MKGQMIFEKKTKSWSYITPQKMTTLSCQKDNNIQSRNGWWIAWSGGYVNHSDNLEEIILWVERTAFKIK
jgi:hypothetical protein